MPTRCHCKPRMSWRPLVPVRWRSHSDAYTAEPVRKRWTLYLFGLLPIARIPRRGS